MHSRQWPDALTPSSVGRSGQRGPVQSWKSGRSGGRGKERAPGARRSQCGGPVCLLTINPLKPRPESGRGGSALQCSWAHNRSSEGRS